MSKYKTFILKLAIIIIVIVAVLSIKTALASPYELPEAINSVEKVVIIDTKTLPIKEYAKYHIDMTFGPDQWDSYESLIKYEVCGKHKDGVTPRDCDWTKRNNAQNPNSTAYGLGQFLNFTWETVGCVKTDDPYTQIDCMIKYVDARYGSPEKALDFHILKNWY